MDKVVFRYVIYKIAVKKLQVRQGTHQDPGRRIGPGRRKTGSDKIGGPAPERYGGTHQSRVLVGADFPPRGDHINVQAGYYGTAFKAASLKGYQEFVTILFNKGANRGRIIGSMLIEQK